MCAFTTIGVVLALQADTGTRAAKSILAESNMPEISPAQRTATTAKIILGAGIVAWGPAFMHGSVMATALAGLLMIAGGGLLIAARRAD